MRQYKTIKKYWKGMNYTAKKLLAGLLAFLTFITTCNIDPTAFVNAFAADGDVYIMYNLKNLTLEGEGDTASRFDNAVCVEYGTAMQLEGDDKNLTLYGAASFESIGYIKQGNVIYDGGYPSNWSDIRDGQVLEPGNYFLNYTISEIDGGEYNLVYGLKVTKGTLCAPSNLSWNAGVLSWDAVTASATGLSLVAGTTVTYDVTLYLDSEEDGDTVIDTQSLTACSVDFTDKITAQGYGTYYATLTARTTNANYQSSEVTTSASYVYSDIVAPVITSYEVTRREAVDHEEYSATAYDAGTGLAGYAFVHAGDEVTDWTAIEENTPGTPVTVYGTVTSAGSVDVCFKDQKGNVIRQTYSEKTTKIVLKKYYRLTGSEEDLYYINGSTLALGSVTPDGKGYILSGWYDNEDCAGSPVTSYTVAACEGDTVTFYPKWEKQTLNFAGNPADSTVTYGTTVTLSASLASYYGTANWQWYGKKTGSDTFTAIEGATTDSLTLSQVADSGEYYAKVTVDLGQAGEEDQVVVSSYATVTIAKKDLYLDITDQTISYSEEPGTFSYALDAAKNASEGTGLCDSDTLAALIGSQADLLTTTYTQGDDKGDYPITASAALTADNYNLIIHQNGTLHVKALDLSANSNLALSFENNITVYPYTGSAITPAVKAQYKGSDFTDYTLTYSNNVCAGEAKASLTFTGNFTGSRDISYTISKTTFAAGVSVSPTSFMYGEAYAAIELTTNPENSAVTWYYKEKTSDTQEFSATGATTTRPTDAGTYWVYGVIAASDNYDTVTTTPTEYTITRRTITLTSQSETWSYDGNTHTSATYTASGDDFATEEGFQYVSVTGSIKDIGSKTNTITYQLTSATKAKNYNIIKAEGTLQVNSSALTTPTTFDWNESTPGKVNWVAITKDGVSIQYIVRLYRTDDAGATYSCIDTQTVTATSANFLDKILADSEDNGRAGYAVTIQVEPIYGANESHNYTISPESTQSNIHYTTKLTITKAENDAGLVGNPMVDGVEAEWGSSVILFEGQSVTYQVAANTTDNMYEVGRYKLTMNTPAYASTTPTDAGFSYSDYYNPMTVSVKNLIGPMDLTVTAASSDAYPTLSYLLYENDPDNQYQDVLASFIIKDGIGLAAYSVARNRSEALTNKRDITALGTKCHEVDDYEITEPGAYYIYIWDTANHCSVYSASSDSTIYETKFAYSATTTIVEEETVYNYTYEDEEDPANTMSHILHLTGTTVTLPTVTYEKPGYVLKNWSGTSGIYSNEGSYNAVVDETLVAQWTDESYSYTVNYYNMNTDGTYNATPDATSTFKTGYNSTITTSTASIQKTQPGFQLDSAKYVAGETSSIRITDQTGVLNLYYERIPYTISYQITGIDGSTVTTTDVEYRYGATVTEMNKPAITGYSFIGWDWGDSGSAPATMPAKALIVTGYYEANVATYEVIYHFQNIDYTATDANFLADNTYSVDEAKTEEITSTNGTVIDLAIADAKTFDGFTAAGLKVSYGTASGTSLIDEGKSLSDYQSASGTVYEVAGDQQQLYVNYYYTRNTYTLTLNVWKGERDSGDENHLYTKSWDYPYGFAFSEEYENSHPVSYYETEGYTAGVGKDENEWTKKWPTDDFDSFSLAGYIDWSTGDAPSAMPAGNAVVTREYIETAKAPYYVNIYFENVVKKDGLLVSVPENAANYTKVATYYYYGTIGSTVKVGEATDENPVTIDEATFSGVEYINQYVYSHILNASDSAYNVSGVIVDTSDGTTDPLTLNVYYERKTVNARVTYYVDGTSKISQTVSGKWGTNYEVDSFNHYGDYVSGDSGDTYKSKGYEISYTGFYYYTSGGSYNYISGKYTSETTEGLAGGHCITYSNINGQNCNVKGNGVLLGLFSAPITNDNHSYTNVYYSELDRSKQYYLDVVRYTSPSDSTRVPVTVTIGDTTYRIRVANKALMYDISDYDSVITYGTKALSDYETYPAEYYFQDIAYDYTGLSLKEGYTDLSTITSSVSGKEIAEGNYYVRTEDDIPYLYIVNSSNPYFKGNYTSYTHPLTDAAGGFGMDYITDTVLAGTGYRIYNRSWGSSIVYNTEDNVYGGDCVITYYRDPVTYTVTYQMVDDPTKISKVSYYSGATVTTGENTTFSASNGYHLAWYSTTDCTEEKATTFKITADVIVYCRMEKDALEGHDYVSYALLSDQVTAIQTDLSITLAEGGYFTRSNLSAAGSSIWTDITENVTEETTLTEALATAGAASDYLKYTDTVMTNITDDYNRTISKITPRTSYYYKGQLILIDQIHWNYTFSNIEFKPALFAKEGFKYDETNVNNKSLGYCASTPVTMYAYFNRTNLTLTVSTGILNDNDKVTTETFGTTESITNPTRNGYTFDSWKYSKSDDSELDADDLGAVTGSGKTVFAMPAYDLKLLAQWNTAEFNKKVICFFEDDAKTYKADLYTQIAGGVAAGSLTTETLTIRKEAESEDTIEVTAYKDGDTLLAVSLDEIYEIQGVNTTLTCYYSTLQKDSKNNSYLDNADLFAAVNTVTFESEDRHYLAHYLLSDSDMFSFSFANYQSPQYTSNAVLQLTDTSASGYTEANSFYADYDMTLSYYYKRTDNIQITAVGKALDGGDETGMTIVGDGAHYYGETMTLYATIAAGYTFKGWFNKADILDTDGNLRNITDFTEDGEAVITDGDETTKVTPVSTAESYEFKVTEDRDFVAISDPGSVAVPRIKLVAGKETYVYGYEHTAKDTVSVSFTDALSGANSVTGYHWYRAYYAPDEEVPENLSEVPESKYTALSSQTTAICNVEVGLSAGTYIYQAVVDIERKDTLRTAQTTARLAVPVTPQTDVSYKGNVEKKYTGDTYEFNFGLYASVKSSMTPHYLTEAALATWMEENEDSCTEYLTEALNSYNAEKEAENAATLAAGTTTTVYEDKTMSDVEEDPYLFNAVFEIVLADHYDDFASLTVDTMPSYKDVKVKEEKDTDGNITSRTVVPHSVYVYITSTNPNYQNGVTSSATLLIQPATLSIVAGQAFKKVYDGYTTVRGDLTDTSSDKYRLADPDNGYYQINGVLSTDQDLKLYLDFDSVYNDSHVSTANQLTLSNMWLYQIAEGEVRYNYNYQFPSTSTSIILSAQITQYELAIEWDSVTNFVYDGITEWAPSIVQTFKTADYKKDHFVPADADNLEITVSNKQMNAGSYQAIATVAQSSAAAGSTGWYDYRDYNFGTITNCNYTVTKRYITIKPKKLSKFYNATRQTALNSENEFEFWTKNTASGDWKAYSLAPGQTFSVEADYTTSANAGDYTLTARNLKIIYNGRNINDNYEITYGSDTLTIDRCPVIVSGIDAKNKEYDSTTLATLYATDGALTAADGTAATFKRLTGSDLTVTGDATNGYAVTGSSITELAGLYGTETMTVNAAKVSAAFDTASVGTGKTVTLTYVADGQLAGSDASNYVLITKGDTYVSEKETTADIEASGLTVSLGNVSLVYGEVPNFTKTITGYQGDEATHSVTGEVTYIIKRMTGEGDSASYETVCTDGTTLGAATTLDVGTYYIFAKETNEGTIDGLTVNDYAIYWDNKPATLTVTARPVTVTAVDDLVITKEYDTTTASDNSTYTSQQVTTATAYADFTRDVIYRFTAVTGNTASGVLSKDTGLAVTTTGFTYNDASVSEANKVTFTGLAINSTNYELKNTTMDATAEITAAPLTITADDASITYGDAKSTITYSVKNITGLKETGDALTALTDAINAAVSYTCAYDDTAAAKRGAGTYDIIPSGYTNTNYAITYTKGILTVDKKTVHIVADTKESYYGTKNATEWTALLNSFTGKFKAADWVYSEDAGTAGLYYTSAGSRVDYLANATDAAITASPVTYSCYSTGTTVIANTDPIGSYAIVPDAGSLSSANYEFEADTSGLLKIVPHYIVIDGVEVIGKQYDGTTSVDAASIVTSGVKYTYYEEGTKHTKEVSAEFLKYITITAEYQNKNAGDYKKVNVHISLKEGEEGSEADYLAKRYVLLTDANQAEAVAADIGFTNDDPVTQTETTAYILDSTADGGKRYTGVITKRPLALSPSNVTILYGDSLTILADNSVLTTAQASTAITKANANTTAKKTYVVGDSFAPAGGTSENFATIGFVLTSEILASDNVTAYTAGSDVGTYTMTIDSSTYGGSETTLETSNNYEISYAAGTLTVNPNQLVTPKVTWDSTNLGTVNWTASSTIGKVAVDSYVVTLYKGGVSVATDTVSADVLTYNWADKIHEAAGEYTVGVKAVASTTDNENKKNVKDSLEGKTADKKYAAKILVKYDTDAVTAGAADATKSTFTLGTTTASYQVLIAGETTTMAAAWKNSQGYATGYSVKSCLTSNENLTISNVTDSSASGSYSAGLALSAGHTATADLTVTLTLDKRAATLTRQLLAKNDAAANGSTVYGYSAEAAPKYQMDAKAADTDNITASGYTYTYNWKYKKWGQAETILTTATTYNTDTISIPQGLKAYQKGNGYLVTCTVTATRMDNGESTSDSAEMSFVVARANPDKTYASVGVTNWTYGETRSTPVENRTIDGLGTFTIYYSTSDAVVTEGDTKDSLVTPTAWTETPPTEVGTYYVQAYVAASENYAAFYSEVKSFKILQAKLTTPANLKMTASGSAPYGQLTWDAVSGPQENNGAEDSKKTIGVTYEVHLYSIDSSEAKTEIILPASYKALTTNSCDVTAYMNDTGKYEFTVKALSDDTDNCAHSDAATSNDYQLHSAIAVTNYNKINDDGEYVRTYDTQAVELNITNDVGETTYQWYRNGAAITGATGGTYDVTYVEQSGTYACVLTIDGVEQYSTHVVVKILPRELALATGSATKAYDGTALTKDEWWIVGQESTSAKATESLTETATGNTVSGIAITGTVTNVSATASTNTVNLDNLVIKEGTKTVYSKAMVTDGTANYTIVTTGHLGSLQVTTRSIVQTGISEPVDQVYDGTAKEQTVIVTDSLPVAGTSLTAGTDYKVEYSANVNVGTVTETITGLGNYTGTVTKTYAITARPLTIKSEDKSKTYDAAALTSKTASATADVAKLSVITTGTGLDLPTGHSLYSVTFTGSQTDAGTSDNTYKDIIIHDAAGVDVTANYSITSTTGSLTVAQASDTVTILKDISKTYDKTAVGAPGTRTEEGVSYNEHNTGALSFTYYDSTKTALISAPVKAGTYYVTATVAETNNFAAATSDYKEFTIAKKPVAFAWSTPITFLYDGEEHGITASITNACAGDEVRVGSYTASGTTLALATDVNSYTATVNALAGTDADNYTLTGATNLSKGWTITKRDRNITVADVTATYDASEHTVSPSDDGDDHAGTDLLATATITYARKNADGTTTAITGNPVHAGTYLATVSIPETVNYKAVTKTATVTINKRTIIVKSASASKEYDGSPLTDTTDLTIVTGTLATGDSLTADITGTITNVKRQNNEPRGSVLSVENTYTNIVITNSNAEIGTTTDDYAITKQYGSLTVSPTALYAITVTPDQLIYTGNKIGPTVKVFAEINGSTVELAEGNTRDYTITTDADAKKQTMATKVGTYTVEATGCNNYTGTVTTTYDIYDDTNPVAKFYDENNAEVTGTFLCKDGSFKVSDATLTKVTITGEILDAEGNVTDTTNTVKQITDGSTEYSAALTGSLYGTRYTVVAEDASGNTNSTAKLLVYKDHSFTHYVHETADGLNLVASCDRSCGATDHAVRRWGTVEWNYEYSYSTSISSDVQSGIQGADARATYVRVELLQNGRVIATKYVDCDANCGVGADPLLNADSASYDFDTYNPADPTADSGDFRIPVTDEAGNNYNYSLSFTTEKYESGEYVEVSDYSISYSQNYTDTTYGEPLGYTASITYQPECFEVPWKVILTGMPTVGLETVAPDRIYVKVLFAYSDDADDTETASGYQIISQQAGTYDLGSVCEKQVALDGTVTYEGSYPVWKYQGGTTDSYYHRIQVVGYEYNGKYYDVADYSYKSINDTDHENHTIYYVPGTADVDDGQASGTILYELNCPALPVLYLDTNEGEDTTNSVSCDTEVIEKSNLGDPVTADELDAVEINRNYYEFQGWMDAAENGNAVTEITSLTETTTLYAKWKELVAPEGEISLAGYTFRTFLESIVYDTVVSTREEVTITAEDTGRGTGVVNSGMASIEYYVADHSLTTEELEAVTWQTYTGSFIVDKDSKVVIYAKLTDRAGNVSLISSDGLDFISGVPVITGVKTNDVFCNETTFTVTDAYLVGVTLNGETIEPIDGVYTLPVGDEPYTIVATNAAGLTTTITGVEVRGEHDYDHPVFAWTADDSGIIRKYTKVDATFTCQVDETHELLTLPCELVSEITKEASYEEEGTVLYTATVVNNGKTYTDTRTVAIPKLIREEETTTEAVTEETTEAQTTSAKETGSAEETSSVEETGSAEETSSVEETSSASETSEEVTETSTEETTEESKSSKEETTASEETTTAETTKEEETTSAREEVTTEKIKEETTVGEDTTKAEQTDDGNTQIILEETEVGKGKLIVVLELKDEDVGSVEADFADRDAVAGIVLTDDEYKLLEDGATITIRLQVELPDEEADAATVDKVCEALGGSSAKVSFLSLTLSKKINDEAWQIISSTNDQIQVKVNLPDTLKGTNHRIVLMIKDGDSYRIVDTAEVDGNTVTFWTNDFESEYILAYVEEDTDNAETETVSDGNGGDDDNKDNNGNRGSCFWHWLILLTCIVESAVIVLFARFYKKRKDEEDENSDNGAADNDVPSDNYGERMSNDSREKTDTSAEASQEDRERKHFRSPVQIIALVLGDVLAIVFAILGYCYLDWPFAVVTLIITALLFVLLGGRKNEKKLEEDASRETEE